MTNDYISRKLAIETFYYQGFRENSMVDAIFFRGIREIIDDMPPADVAPVIHARWIAKRSVCGEREFQCSACRKTEWRTDIGQFKFCPFCGDKMDGGRQWIKTPRYTHLSRLSRRLAVYRAKMKANELV